MARRLPSLNALRAFEAGARHLSFTHAAEELAVTQAAISHQVKALEADLGVPLFRRYTRRLALTEAGRHLQPAVSEAFARIAQAVGELRRDGGERLLTVSLTPSFAAKWLVRRLNRFRQAHPDIDLRLLHSDDVVDFARDEVDLAVRWGRGGWSGVESELLRSEVVMPVCSPALRDGEGGLPPLRRPDDLRHHTLIHDYDHKDWLDWLRAAGVEHPEARRGPLLDESSIVIQAAIEGQGVALCDYTLLRDDLDAGRLVLPFEIVLPGDYAHYIVTPPGALKRPKVKAFRDFLLAEAAAEQGAEQAG